MTGAASALALGLAAPTYAQPETVSETVKSQPTEPAVEETPESQKAFARVQAERLKELLKNSPETGNDVDKAYDKLVETQTVGEEDLVSDDYDIDVTEGIVEEKIENDPLDE
ncbi:MAG: hypothetical protein CMK09_19160 [Ponticaulis sp.]|nr:hypothetical protein [Ponticaulis sp.]